MVEQSPVRWYPSKVDWWMWPLLALPLFSGAGAVMSASFARGSPGMWDAVSIPVVIVVVYAGLVFPMRYAITDTELLVRHGLVTRSRPLAKIVAVTPTYSPLSAPALSLDRLNIDSGGSFFATLLISPTDQEEFLSELQQKAGLIRQGRGLVRAAGGPPS